MMMIGRYRPITKSMRLGPGSIQHSTIGCRDAQGTRRCIALASMCGLVREGLVTAGFDVGAERPARPTIAQLREVTQPPSVRTRAAAEHWVAHAYLRDISPYLTRILLRAGFSANGVTWLMIMAAAAAVVATGWPALLGAVLAVILVQLQMLLDCCDGEVARWRQTSSPVGVYLDRVGHYVAECGIAVALGIRATGQFQLSGIWISAGLLLGLLVALNKVENDLVHVARHYAGLPQMADAKDVRTPRGGFVRGARRLAGVVPFHRVFHSVELSILVLIAAIVDLFVNGAATKVLLAALVVAACLTLVGHLVAVLTSSRLR
jgi:phosphatidylglycerophosphate synthase